MALLDIEMPGPDGSATTAAIRAACPGTRSLIVTTFCRPGYLARALESGASREDWHAEPLGRDPCS